jgi:hypothetical protein
MSDTIAVQLGERVNQCATCVSNSWQPSEQLLLERANPALFGFIRCNFTVLLSSFSFMTLSVFPTVTDKTQRPLFRSFESFETGTYFLPHLNTTGIANRSSLSGSRLSTMHNSLYVAPNTMSFNIITYPSLHLWKNLFHARVWCTMINKSRVRYNFFYPTSRFEKSVKLDMSFITVRDYVDWRQQQSVKRSHWHRVGILTSNNSLNQTMKILQKQNCFSYSSYSFSPGINYVC